MKTRSSSGVGQKIDLAFNVDTLRIEDLGEDEEHTPTSTGAGSIAAALKRTNAPTAPDELRDDPSDGDSIGKIRAKTDSTKLRDFLNNLGD